MNTHLEPLEPALEHKALQSSLQLLTDDMEETSDDALQKAIEMRVIEMLSKHPERLMSVLYRIDVAEEKVDDIMKNAPVASIASRITQLIIERMRAKVLTREQYRRASQQE